jgi:two-component system, NarL family, sensor histidine kinase UhpB
MDWMRSSALRLAVRCLAWCWALLACLPALALHEGNHALTIGSALSAEGDTTSFPITQPARSVGLPDDWANSRPGSAGPVWYRVAFTAAAPPARDDLLALYIERVCTNVEVFVNGKLVHSGGRMQLPYTHNCNHPQLVSLPAALIQPGANLLDLKVVGHPAQRMASRQRAGGLSPLIVGLHSELAPVHARQSALLVGIPQGVTATLAVMGSFMFVMGWINRRESHLAYFGALCVGWALVELRLWLRELPIEDLRAEFLLASTMAFITLAAAQFLLRYARLRERIADVGLPLQCVLMPLTLIIAGPDRMQTMTQFWYTLLVLEVAAAGALYLAVQWRIDRRAFWGMLLMLLIVGAAEFIGSMGLGLTLPATVVVVARATLPTILLIVGLRLIQQHGSALQHSEAMRGDLEARVAKATAEIEQNYRQMSELRVEQVTERERKRIAADLHDDLGAKLLTIVHTSESERISTLAREALEEMRLSVRGLTGKPVRLEDALGDWRAEVVSRLNQAGIEGAWSMPIEDLPHTLSARAFVQTTRILREAVSNIIKHSGASQCSVSCGVAEGDFQLVIQDNGEGISLEVDGRLDRGHGMSSMKHRAKQLQGQCLVESGPGYGTVIRLTLPLGGATTPA